MAVAYRSSNSQDFNGDPWSFTSAPAGTAENDILIAWIDFDTVGVTIDSVPSGWTLIEGPVPDTPGGHNAYIYWKRAGASEAGPYEWGLTGVEQGMIAMAAYSGAVTSGDPQDVAGDAVGTVASTSHTSGTIVTVTDNCLIVCLAANDLGVSGTPQWSDWTNSAVERIDVESPTFVNLGIADYTKTPAGSTSFTVTAANSGGAVIGIVALKPADAAVVTDANLAPRRLGGGSAW